MIATIQSAARLLSFSLLTLVAQVHTAEAFPAFGDDWKLVYPLSMSAANAETGVGTTVCQLCHANALGGVPWNGYGFDLRLARTDPGCDLNADSFVSVEEGLLCIEKLNSDGDSPGFSNIDEIDASTQPGWTVGSNMVFNREGGVSTISPPDVAGQLDPVDTGLKTMIVTGTVESIDAAIASGPYALGDPMTAVITYDGAAPDTLPGDPGFGNYPILSYGFTVGGYSGSDDGRNIATVNDFSGRDEIRIEAARPFVTGSPVGGLPLKAFEVVGRGPDTIFLTDALPESLDVEAFTSGFFFNLIFDDGGAGPPPFVSGSVTSVTIAPSTPSTDLEFVSFSSFSPRADRPGPACNVVFSYRNPTKTDTGAFEIAILIDGKLVRSVVIDSQLATTTTTLLVVAASIPTKPDPHTITVILDSGEAVDEVDETNNTGIVGLHVEDKDGDGVADVCEAVPVKPPDDKTGEEPDGNFFLDVGGDVFIQLVSTVSESRSFFVIDEPAEKKPSVCLAEKASIDKCYFDTDLCKTTKICPKTPGPPTAIDDFQVQGECGFGELTLSWSEPLTCDAPIEGFTVHIEEVATGITTSISAHPGDIIEGFPKGSTHQIQVEASTSQGSSLSNVVTVCEPGKSNLGECPCGTVEDYSAFVGSMLEGAQFPSCRIADSGDSLLFVNDFDDLLTATLPFQTAIVPHCAVRIEGTATEFTIVDLTDTQVDSCLSVLETAVNLSGLTCETDETPECPCGQVEGIASNIESQKELGENPTCSLEQTADKTTFLTIDGKLGNLIFSDLPDQGKEGKEPVCGTGPDSSPITDAEALSCVSNIEAAAKLTGLKCEGFKKDGTDDKKACENETELVGTFEKGTLFRTAIHVDVDGDGAIEYVLNSDPTANADGIDYLHTLKVGPGSWLLQWEDELGGGDQDFNDLVVLLFSRPPGSSLGDSFLPGFIGTPGIRLLNNITIDPLSIPADERLLRLTTGLSNYGSEVDVAVCSMLNFTGTKRTGQGYTYLAGDGIPDCNLVLEIEPSVRLTLDELQPSPLQCPSSPPPTLPRGDIITLPAAIGSEPGVMDLFYEIPLSAIGANLENESPEVVRERLVNSGLGVYLDTIFDFQPGVDALICPNGVGSYFDAQPDESVAKASYGWYTPVIQIFSPVEIPTALYSSLVFGRDVETEAIINIQWEDNLPVPLSGHLTHDPPIRSPFTILPGTKPKGLLTAQFPDDLPDGFMGKAVILVTEVETGSSIVASAYFFSKDASPPEITQVRTVRSDSGIDIEVVAQDAGAGLNAIRVISTVNGTVGDPTTLDLVSGNFRESSIFAGEIGGVAPADAVMVQVEVDDEFENALGVNLPIASAGEDFSIECTSPGGASVPLDGSNSATPPESPTTFLWNSDFGTASGETVQLSLPIGSHDIGLRLEDGRGYTSTDAAVVTVADTSPPDLTVSVSPAVLWPPNHKLVEITPELTVSDSCDSAPLVELLNITMNEGSEASTFDPAFDNTVAAGHTVDDIQVDEDGRVFLRAERMGTGEGRVYTLTYRATDVFGNSTTATATVTVPHNL